MTRHRCPDLFPTAKKQDKERQRLFKIIEELVKWENTNNEAVLEKARTEIGRAGGGPAPRTWTMRARRRYFNRNKLPGFHDPFAGGGALPLEAQSLGLESYASDLNPVAVLINKAMIETPATIRGQAAGESRSPEVEEVLSPQPWKGDKG
ncbi:MAG: DNA adenine methylase [Planctomycetota bacterium]